MQDEQIKERIAGFPHWHYQFDLKGNLTPIFTSCAISPKESKWVWPLTTLLSLNW